MATIKQKKAVKKILESKGKVSVSKAMRDAGYPPTTAKNPQQLTQSKGYRELMDKYLPDKLLAKKHKELLTVPKKITIKRKGMANIEMEELDTFAISKGLDMAYKIKGHYSSGEDKTPPTPPIQITKNILVVINDAEEKVKQELIKQIND